MLKTISSITNALGALNYKGTWNASSNTPTLADGTGAKGDYYVVSTAGTQTFGGVQLFFGLGDWIAYNGAVWQRVEGGSDGNFANVTLTSTDAGATAAPLLDLYRDSASPAASDTLGEIEFNGEDSAGNKQTYGLIHASILSPTSTTEQGQLHFETATAGALTEKMIIGTSNLVINEIGAVFNVRIEGDTDANLFYTDATNSRVGVGTITPASKFEVAGGDSRIDNGNLVFATTAKGLNTASSIPLTFNINSSEAFRVDTTKSLCIGDSGNFGAKVNIVFDPASTNGLLFAVASGTFTNNYIYFQNSGGSKIGSVSSDNSSVTYNTTSDYRIKTNIQPITGALAKVAQLNPVTYDWKPEFAEGSSQGFIAHELQAIVPECVTGEKDEIDENGKPKYQGIDTSFLVATLTAAIKELKAEFDAYKAQHP
jgi:hypothetical protein